VLKARAGLISSLLLFVDVLASALVFAVAASRPELQVGVGADGPRIGPMLVSGLVASLAWPLILEQLDLYASQRRSGLEQLLGRLLLAGAISTALMVLALGITGARVRPVFPLVVGAGQFCALAGLRLIGLGALRLLRRHGRNTRNVLVVGSGNRARHVLHQLQRHPEWGLQVVGFLDDCDSPHDPRIPVGNIYKLMDLPNIIRSQVIDEVIVACPRTMLGEIGPVVATCATAGIPMTLLSDIYGDYLPPPQVTRFGSLAALSFVPVHHSRSQLAVKRLIDVLGATLGLLAAAPVVAIAAVAIKATSEGPVFFQQIRCGKHGRPFRMWKLRSMVADAEARKATLIDHNEMDGPVFKMKDDPRVTPVGALLRRWSIDELPQFWNVLRGDMSLVGARPPVPHEVAEYETFDRRRLSMRPGITCLWQVSGRNEISSFGDWVKLDLEYIDTWSLWLDLKILLRTLLAVARGTGR
jgi:exopolysaccharide biosynthesis polyprenyl glycosylphosphotransferase